MDKNQEPERAEGELKVEVTIAPSSAPSFAETYAKVVEGILELVGADEASIQRERQKLRKAKPELPQASDEPPPYRANDPTWWDDLWLWYEAKRTRRITLLSLAKKVNLSYSYLK
jgi:hypothetical protein